MLLSVRMAWLDYLYTGDDRSLRQFYDVLKAKTLMELFGSDGFLDTSPDNQSREFKESIHLTFGDRLIDLVDWPAGERDGFVMTGTNGYIVTGRLRNTVLSMQTCFLLRSDLLKVVI